VLCCFKAHTKWQFQSELNRNVRSVGCTELDYTVGRICLWWYLGFLSASRGSSVSAMRMTVQCVLKMNDAAKDNIQFNSVSGVLPVLDCAEGGLSPPGPSAPPGYPMICAKWTNCGISCYISVHFISFAMYAPWANCGPGHCSRASFVPPIAADADAVA